MANRRVMATAVAMLAVAGCAHNKPAETATRPTAESMDKVVADINANSAAIPSLWARHYFAGDIVDDKGKKTFLNAEGVMLMLKPHSMRMTANKPGTKVFDMGTDGTRYWMSVPVEVDTMWWGYSRNLDKPCSRQIPIRPDSILQVLGVGEIDAKASPAPAMRFDTAVDAYVFTWKPSASDRSAATKEVWYDRSTRHPTRVVLYDPDGRVVLRAGLEDFKPIEVDGQPKDRWPTLARIYRLSFPESGSKITLSLDEVLLRTEDGFPAERSFVMPDPDKAGVAKVVQIDEDCGQ